LLDEHDVLLAIDTATEACSIALVAAGGVLLAQAHEIVGRGHAERLVPMIAALTASHAVTRIAAGCGPGSFTGIRVGIAAARGLALGWGVPLTGVSSLALIAAAVDEDVAVAITGGHGELFVQRFAAGPLRAVAPLAALTPAAAAGAVPERLVLGSGAEALVAARGHGEARAAWPRAGDIIRLPAGFTNLPPRPLYGRAPDARVPA
jgi:tRNA threonylcarbamoyladenosine biosynthesis protein TsaB